MLSRSTSTDLAFRTLSNDLHHVETNPHAAKDVINVPVVSAVAMALFCDFLLLTLCIPILPELFKDTQFAGFETGLVFASKPFFQFFANPIMGSYVEVHGPRAPLLMGVLILSISTIVFAFGTSLTSDVEWSFAVVMIARSTQGLASASIMSAGMTLCAMTHNEQIRGSAMGLAFTGVALGTLLGPPIGGILGYYVYLWFPFALVSIVLLIVYVVMRILFRDFKNGSDYPASELSKSLLDSCPSHSELPVAVEHADATHGVLKLLKEPIILYVGAWA